MNAYLKFRKFFFGTLQLFSVSLLGHEPQLTVDILNDTETLPKHFRICQELSTAGSGQFSQKQLLSAKKQLKMPCILVDLRQECHGFINGMAVSWYGKHNAANAKKALHDIVLEEIANFKNIQQAETVSLLESKPGTHHEKTTVAISVLTAFTEHELASRYGFEYFRIPVTDHKYPEPEMVDRFITFIKELPSKTMLYFHCRGGDGRTTTFMAMYDMMKNAKKASLDEILTRQWQLGGHNLAQVPSKFSFRAFCKEERYDFVQQFYQFCRESDANFSENWSTWAKSKSYR